MFRKPNRSNPYSFSADFFWELMESNGIKNKLTCINPGGVFCFDKGGIQLVSNFEKGKEGIKYWGSLIL